MQCSAKKHGMWHVEKNGCRCPQHREELRIFRKRRQHGRWESRWVDATGTLRRIQAMMWMDWSGREQSRRMGRSNNYVSDILKQSREPRQGIYKVSSSTRDRVAKLYSELMWRRGSDPRAGALARERGWFGPLHWDDIDNPREKSYEGHNDHDAVVRQTKEAKALAERGFPYQMIAEKLGISRHQARRRLGLKK